MKNKMRAVRLDTSIEQILSEAAELLGVTKSDVIKESIVEYCAKVKQNKPYSIYLSVMAGLKDGEFGSTKSLSKDWREDFKSYLRQRKRRSK